MKENTSAARVALAGASDYKNENIHKYRAPGTAVMRQIGPRGRGAEVEVSTRLDARTGQTTNDEASTSSASVLTLELVEGCTQAESRGNYFLRIRLNCSDSPLHDTFTYCFFCFSIIYLGAVLL